LDLTVVEAEMVLGHDVILKGSEGPVITCCNELSYYFYGSTEENQ